MKLDSKNSTTATATKVSVSSEPEVNTVLEINKQKYNLVDIQKKVVTAAKKSKANVDKVEIYIVADQNTAYYVVDGEGKAEYKVNL